MSRETDTPSSGPQGRGSAAYPSGTPPYGTPTGPDAGADAGRSASRPDERKTETTLTTRIRINIPGSRPIPPVVMRKPVGGAEDGAGEPESEAPVLDAPTQTVEAPAAPARPGGPSGSSGPSGPVGLGGTAGAAGATGSAGSGGPGGSGGSGREKPTSDWFAPRKSPAAKGGQGGGGGKNAGPTGGSGTGAAAPGAGAGRPGGVVGSMNAPGGSRSSSTGGAGATGGPVAPGHGGGTGSFDVTEALAAGPLGDGSRPGAGPEPRRDDLPFFSEPGSGDRVSGGSDASRGPAGPTGGPVTGDGLLTSPTGPAGPGGPAGRSGPGGPDGFGGPGSHGVPGGPTGLGGPAGPGTPAGLGGPTGPGTPAGLGGPTGPGTPAGLGGPTGPGTPAGLGGPTGPGTPGGLRAPGAPGGGPRPTVAGGIMGGLGATTGPNTSAAPDAGTTPDLLGTRTAPGTPTAPGAGLSDDTAILTPQTPAPEPPGGVPFGNRDNVSGNTVTSGIPVVPGDSSVPFQGGAPVGGPSAQTPPARPEPAAAAAPAAAAKPAPAKKKGRRKLPLLVGAVIVVGGLVYGAGLLMNHSDVPKGTTVLGVDIGDSTRDDAVEKLDATFEKRVNKELKLTVDGETVSLKPDQAGLQFDTQATVDIAAQSDYNPVTVIAALFGNHRVVNPVMPVDEEKLQAALEDAAGGSGSMTEGTIEFKSGKAVAVYPKAGQGIDAEKSADAVTEAYRTQVETGSSSAVKVATTAKQPEVTKAEVDREMKEFAEPAMSANVVVQTDAAHTIEMSPQNSLWKFLRVTAVNGKLVDKPDLDALEELYGQTFDGVLIARANGEKTEVTPEDVYGALRQALLSKTDRVAVIDTNPS
ncbi:hypothetical protein J7I94_36340 [Streptomyces sp. ISL-12]|uniref:hypothetical protein n=1 Tax=Streptomyces sp. ISL-12 TaxID=2819177 RepID=UPI001BE73620|nr:hypothetical protein [Streptomyces sp. ISL-12]MBT2415934.1 hypothetical protein [Streptomyces sp. ISL-12]